MKIPYYPGCTLKTTAKSYEDSAIECARIMGIEMVEIPRWNCCGTVYSLAADDLMHHIASIRNLIRVQEMNEDEIFQNKYQLLTLCSMCFNTLKRANLRIKQNSEDLAKINNFMNLEKDYDGNIEVIHFLELLKEIGYEKVAEKVVNPLKNMKISPYYGCMLLRPKDVGIDDPEDPNIMEDLLVALGAEVVNNPFKKMCCGSYQTILDKYMVSELAYDILIKGEDAEAIVTCCPLCAFNLDSRQKEVKEKHPDFNSIPVFYITQLMAVAFGLDNKYNRFDLNYVNPQPLLKSKALLK